MSRPVDVFGLSKILFEMGYSSCNTLDNAMRVMENRELNPMSIARVLTMMVRTHSSLTPSPDATTWNIENFVAAEPGLDWTAVMHGLDSPEFVVYDATGLKILVDAWNYSQKDSHQPFPAYVFMQPWRNVRGHLSVLYQMIYGSPDVLDLSRLPLRKIIRDTHIQALPMSVRASLLHLASQQLNCLDLIEAIIKVTDTSVADDVRLLMDRLVLQAPELLLLGLAQIQPIKNELHRDLLLRLFNIFMNGHANSILVVMLLWNIHSGLLLEGFLDMYKSDPTSISRILDLAQESKILSHVLRAEVPFFALDMASLAARRQHLNMEKWLNERISEDGMMFAVACINFLETKYTMEMSRRSGANSVPTLQLSTEVIKTFFRVLSEKPLSPTDSLKVGKLIQVYSQLYPQLSENHPNHKDSEEVTDTERSYSPEVEEIVRVYFEKLYTNGIDPSRFADILRACQDSKDQRQADFFLCTLHTLLDEARFFNQYPENELMATGELLGLLIDQRSISFDILRVALKHVLDALNYPPGSKMFNFGAQALAQFQGRLSEWPQYTFLLSRIKGLSDFPALTDNVADALQKMSLQEADLSSGNAFSKEPKIIESSEDKTLTAKKEDELGPNVGTLLQRGSEKTYQDPPLKVQERVSFLINNLSISNLESKKTELDQLLHESTWGWFSHYLVVRRVSIEPNNHELYAALLKTLQKPSLIDSVVEETYNNIRLLIQSDNNLESSDRNMLKNLGSWLGRMTLARNKPIRHKDLSFKDLLLDAYDKDRLIVAIPLTCKILQHTTESKIFKPPNPWLMSILKLLAELYWSDNLKLNLKFEIELLYKALNIDLEKTEPSSILLKRAPPGIDVEGDKRRLPKVDPEPRSNAASPVTASDSIPDFDITALLSKLQFTPAIAQFMIQQPVAKTTVYRAISEAFEEIVPPIIATSSNIAVASTKELVLKDFATDPDEVKVRQAAHAMVQPLAANLAMVTCKEPLYKNMLASIRVHLMQVGFLENLSEEVATLVTSDNIDIACLFVEHLAQTRATAGVDRALSPAYFSRIGYRDQHNPSPYFDVLSLHGAPHDIQLPEFLRSAGSINPRQMNVYESFHDMYTGGPSYIGYVGPESHGDLAQPLMDPNQDALSEKLEQALVELDRLVRECGIPSCAQLPPNHDICLLIRQIPLIITQSTTPLRIMLSFVEKLVFVLYQSTSPFALEIYTVFLQSLFELSGEAAKETLAWIIYSDDDRKYNAPVIAMLMRHELLPLEEYDVQLAKKINIKADMIIEYSVQLIRLCLLNNPITFLEDHILTVASLDKLAKEEKDVPESVVVLLRDLKQQISLPYTEINPKVDCLEMRILLAEWVRLCQHPMATEAIYRALAKKVLQATQDEEGRCFFFRLCIETCVNQSLTFSPNNASHQRRVGITIDSFSKLVRYTIIMEPRKDDKAKIKYLSDTLSIVILVLANHHQTRGTNFYQKPFLRLLSSLFSEISKIGIKSVESGMIIAFSNTLYTLQPMNFPGFAFSWLQLISHRNFLPQLMVVNDSKGSTMCQKLVLSVLRFLGPLLEKRSLQSATKTFYRGTLRVLVVLLHDFPEFVCNNYMVFSQAIPHSCIQLRNLVLSAFPRAMLLPDPFKPDSQSDDLPEYKEQPVLDTGYARVLQENGFKDEIDQYVKDNGKDVAFLSKALKNIKNDTEGSEIHQEVLAAFVLYIGSKVVETSESNVPMENNVAVGVFRYLLANFESEGRYILLNDIADHLRYPNSHTHFFSKALLFLFEDQPETVKEQITRVLLERLIVNRPHPWGLLASFIELIKDPDFWNHEFIRCSPDIERLFENVYRSIKQTP
ncbi:CCR4-Not complex component, Not1-domain-containing protein [Phycomyces nitens]|nr:CCR4-Not complex component, Not1-domain-containing protein [Phycomyces nitens]